MPPSRNTPIRINRPRQPHATDQKNSGMAAVLSFIWTGIGQVYNGQIGKGIAMALIQLIFVILSFAVIGIPFMLVMWVWGIYDAYQTAERINSAG